MKKMMFLTLFSVASMFVNAQDTIRMTFVEEEYYMYSKSFRIAYVCRAYILHK